jgi:tetratricopeptide (TPR) repeat protein
MGHSQRRITLLFRSAWAVALACAVGQVWAQTTISAQAPAAAWSNGPRQWAVVSPHPISLSTLPSTWQVKTTRSNQHYVVHVTTPRQMQWGATLTGNTFVFTPNSKHQPVAKPALLLATGWKLNDQPVTPIQVGIRGQAWDVVLVNTPVRAGAARLGIARRNSTAKAPVAVAQSTGTSSPSATATITPAAPATNSSPINLTAHLPIAFYAAIEPAAGLAATPTPTVNEETLGTPFYPNGLPLAWTATGLQPLSGAEQAEQYIIGQALSIGPQPTTESSAAQNTPPPIRTISFQITPTNTVSPSMTSATTVAPFARVPNVPAQNERTTTTPITTLFPSAEGNYFNTLVESQQAIAEAPAGSVSEREAKQQLAALYLAWQRPEEAAAVLSTLPKRADGLPAGAIPRLMYGLSQIARGAPPSENVFDQGGSLATAARLWQAVGLSQQGEYSAAVNIWPRLTSRTDILAGYPTYLSQQVQEAQLAALVFTGQNSAASKAFTQLAKAYASSTVPTSFIRLGGLAKMGTAQEQLGLEMLAEAAESKTDPATAVRAKYEFVRALSERREISIPQTIKYLEDLRMDWRGDSTEREILLTLGNLYEKTNSPRKALECWQTVVNAFPKTPDMAMITQQMGSAFTSVFDPESNTRLDDLSFIGLYYDFRELLPNDDTGDRVQEFIAELLNNSTLWERAIPLLEQQLQYRPLEPVAQGRLALLLAQIYRKTNQPEEALKLLDKWQDVATTQVLKREWAINRAQSELALNRPTAVVDILKGLDISGDKTLLRLQTDAYWQAQNWPQAAAGLNNLIRHIPSSELVSNTQAQLDVFKLGYAYGQMQDAQSLKALKQRYRDAWPKLPSLADNLNAVAASTGLEGIPPEGGKMEQLTTALAQINQLDNRIRSLRQNSEEIRQKREEYNNRIRYQELLPPPSI